MTQIKKLFKFQLDNKFNIFKQRDLKSILLQVAKYLVLICAITLGLYLIFNNVVFILGIKINAEFLSIVLLLTQLITFCFAVANIISTLYLSKDNELLMVLPVTFNQLFVSKIMILYVSDLMFSLLYILPIFLTLGFLGSLPFTYFLVVLLFLPILPLLPIAIASVISIPIMFVIKYFKRHVIVSIIFILAVVATLFIVYMNVVSKISGAFNIADKQIETALKLNNDIIEIGSSIPAYNYLAKSMFSFKYIYFPVIFLVVAFTLMCGCFLLIKPFYYKIATITTENNSTIKSKYKKFKKRKPYNELLLNEIRQVFRSPSYIFQYFLFPLFMPLIVFTYDKLLVSIAVNQAGQDMILGSHVLVLTIIALMSNTISSTAISKEGGTFYIAKTTPISFYTQVAAKVSFNAIFTLGAVFITTIISLIFSNLNVVPILITSLSVMILSLGHIMHSFDLDLQNPVLDWYDNSEISTIGKNTTKSIIYALALAVVMCLILTFLGTLGIYVSLIFSIIYAVGRLHLLYVRTKYYYNKMEI